MAYVRKKKIKGGEYYYLVEGYRDEDGKVRQRVIKYLGKHGSMEEARLAAGEGVVPKDRLKQLEEINAEYLVHFKAWMRRSQESTDIYYELVSLKGVRSRAATAQRARLKERQAEITALYDKADAALLRAREIFDKLSPVEQESVRALPLGVISHLEDTRRSRASARRLSS
jgi:hypothetical protein